MVASHEYDGYGRRIAKTSGGVTEDYYYNTGYQIIEVHRGGTMREQLVWNVDYVDSLAVRFNDGNANGTFLDANEHHYAMQDGNFNMTSLADSAGTVFERYLYSAYGNRTVLDAGFTLDADNVSDVGNPYTYTGRQFDPETGLYYYRARFYHAQLGRFCGRDPLEYNGNDSNLFGYGMSNLIVRIDLDGTTWWGCTVAVCCVISAGTAYGGVCATTGFWDVPGEGAWECTKKCVWAILDGQIMAHPTGFVWTAACVGAVSACGAEVANKYFPRPNGGNGGGGGGGGNGGNGPPVQRPPKPPSTKIPVPDFQTAA